MNAQTAGAEICVDDKGQPVARPRPAATADELAALARQQRDGLLNSALAVLDRHEQQKRYGLSPTLTDEQAQQWAVYVQGLRDVPQQGQFPTQIDWPRAPA
nr:phage tail assembly chaperone [Chromobacterium sp. ATCC 53434]